MDHRCLWDGVDHRRSVSGVAMSFTPQIPWPEEIEHFSASSAKMAVRCPEQWRQRYILGKKAPPSLAMLGGRADHGAIEMSMRQKITSYEDLPVAEVKKAFVEILENAVEKSGGVNELESKTDNVVREYDDLRRSGQLSVATYHTIASPFLQPVAVEEKFEIQVPGLPVKVIGYIDLIANDVTFGNEVDDASNRMIDRKRRARSTRNIEPEWKMQAEIYQLAEPIPFDWHVTVDKKEPEVLWGEGMTQEVPPKARSERLLNQIVSQIGFYYTTYGPDQGWPVTGKLHPWSCGYCGYRDDCWGWK